MLRTANLSVSWEAYNSTATDSRGNPVPGWKAAATVKVYAFAPSGFEEPVMAGHERTVQVPTLYMPPSVVFGAQDRVTVHGLKYEVQGDTRVWVHPNGDTPGNVVELKRVTG